jgi:hypothetical protein
MAVFKLEILAHRDSKGKFKHLDAGTQFLARFKEGNDSDEE